MKIQQITPNNTAYPAILKTIASPPRTIYCLGVPLNELLKAPVVAIVGSRKVSPYGKSVTEQLATDLASRGVVIVSGLALGVDGIAQKAAIEAGGKVIAVLPNGLDQIYPASNRELAKQILNTGGAIITEYPAGSEPFKSNFVARNRIVSGLAQALLITEAAEKSGSLHTANFALEQNREVCVVPGNINSPYSAGTNNLIKSGATVVTDVNDVLAAIGLDSRPVKKREIIASNENEYILMHLINDGVFEADELLINSELETDVFNQTLTMLEITGKIKPAGAGRWHLT